MALTNAERQARYRARAREARGDLKDRVEQLEQEVAALRRAIFPLETVRPAPFFTRFDCACAAGAEFQCPSTGCPRRAALVGYVPPP